MLTRSLNVLTTEGREKKKKEGDEDSDLRTRMREMEDDMRRKEEEMRRKEEEMREKMAAMEEAHSAVEVSQYHNLVPNHLSMRMHIAPFVLSFFHF